MCVEEAHLSAFFYCSYVEFSLASTIKEHSFVVGRSLFAVGVPVRFFKRSANDENDFRHIIDLAQSHGA